jgi:hypothetical protein
VDYTHVRISSSPKYYFDHELQEPWLHRFVNFT